MSLLFERDRTVISRHIRNIFKEGKLEESVSCAKIAHQVGGQTYHVVFYNLEEVATRKEYLQVQTEGDRKVARLLSFYNLDLIISLGYRINTKSGIDFRRWATNVLKEYLNEKQVSLIKKNNVTKWHTNIE